MVYKYSDIKLITELKLIRIYWYNVLFVLNYYLGHACTHTYVMYTGKWRHKLLFKWALWLIGRKRFCYVHSSILTCDIFHFKVCFVYTSHCKGWWAGKGRGNCHFCHFITLTRTNFNLAKTVIRNIWHGWHFCTLVNV